MKPTTRGGTSMRQPLTPRQLANVLRLRAHELRYKGRDDVEVHEKALAAVRDEFRELADLLDRYDDVNEHGQLNAKADRIKRGEEKESWER